MDELRLAKARLRDLARSKPTAKRRAEVEALLQSKWEGVQVSAANVLAVWGGHESVSALRRWLSEGTQRDDALEALGKCVGDDDVEWALDRYFKDFADPKQRNARAFWPLVVGLPREPTLALLRREAKQGSVNREAASVALKWIKEDDQWLREHPRSERIYQRP